MSKKFLLITLAVPLLGIAEDGGPIRGPVAGFIHDRETRSIRPVLGVPGSSYLGAAIVSDADAASIAADGAAVLAVQQSRLIVVKGIKTPAPEIVAVEGALPDADLFAWSRTSAAIYSSTTRQAQLLRDLATTPKVAGEFDLSGVPGTVVSLALSGESLLAGTEGGGVFLMNRGQSARLIATAQNPSAFAMDGADLYFADRDSGSIWQVRDFAGDSAAAVFTAGIDAPVALYANSGRLFVASAGGKQLRIFDMASKSETASLELEFTPASFDFVGDPSLLLMAKGVAGEQPYYLLDASQNPAVFFVPAGRDQ